MKITFIGTSSGLSVLDRSHACVLFEVRERKVLADCGEGTVRSLLKQGIDPASIDTVVLSHTHPDHCAGLPTLMQYMHLQKREEMVRIYLPTETGEIFQQFYNQMFLLNGDLTYNFDFFQYCMGTVLNASPFSVLAIENRHLRKYYPQRQELGISIGSFALIFCEKENSVYYSGDLADQDDLSLPGRAEAMIVECTHIPIEVAVKEALEHRIKRLIFTHIGPEIENTDPFERNGVKVEFAYDGMSFEV